MRAPIYDYRITDYDRSLVPSRFVAFLDDGVVDPDDWISRSGRTLGHPGWGWIYHTTLMLLDPSRPNVLIETGTNVGTTTILLAQAVLDSGRDAVVHTIEIDEEIHAEASRRFELAGVATVVQPHLGDSIEVLQRLVPEVDEIALAFLDGNHMHDHVVREFELVVDRIRDDGLVVLDNTALIAEGDEDPRVHGALRTIVSMFGLLYCHLWPSLVAGRLSRNCHHWQVRVLEATE